MGGAEDGDTLPAGAGRLARAWLRAARQVEVLFRTAALPSPTQWDLLDILLERGPLPLMDTAAAAGISGATAARAVDAAAARGWLVKDRDPQDRRIVWLRVTPAGEVVHREVVAATARRLQALLAGVDPEDRAHLAKALEHMLRKGRGRPEERGAARSEEAAGWPGLRE
jgi:DNA-binding MarR family transcriptional regulator